MSIRILHDPQTLLHHSIELIAQNQIPAYESPDRITRILDALRETDFANRISEISFSEDELTWPTIPESVHSAAYVTHLRSIYKRCEDAGFVDKHDERDCLL